MSYRLRTNSVRTYVRVIFQRHFVFSEENYTTSYYEFLLVNRVKGEVYSNDPCTEYKVKKIH